MDLFKWVGRKKREEEWMAQPRRVPSFAKDLTEDHIRWMVTQEFVNDEDKNLRLYLGVIQPDPKVERWIVYHVEYDLKRDESYVRASNSDDTRDPMEVVKALREYEDAMKLSPGYIPHPDHRGGYRAFANKYGIHFDDDGNVFRVAAEMPLAKGTFMSRDSLDKLFHKEASKTIPLDSWEGIYKGVVEFRSPAWTMTEDGFGLTGGSLNATALLVQHDARAWEPLKPAETAKPQPAVISDISQLKPGGGVYIWQGSVATIPTAAQIQEHFEKLEKEAAEAAAAKLLANVEATKLIDPAAKKPGAPEPSPSLEPVASRPIELPVVVEPPVTIGGKTFAQMAQEKTWANHEPMQKITWDRPVTRDDVVEARGYPEYAYYMKQMMDKLRKLPDVLTDKATDRYAKELAIKEMSRYAVNIPFTGAPKDLAKHEADATILVGLLRAGCAVYAEQFGPGKKMSPEGLQLMSTIGKICVQFAVDRLNIPADQAAKVADVITKGKDPNGAELPLDKIFAKYPAAAFTPAPQPAYVPPTPKKNPPTPKTGKQGPTVRRW